MLTSRRRTRSRLRPPCTSLPSRRSPLRSRHLMAARRTKNIRGPLSALLAREQVHGRLDIVRVRRRTCKAGCWRHCSAEDGGGADGAGELGEGRHR